MRKPLSLAGVASAAFLLLHLPFTPPSLEDLDSFNFALGVRAFDVSQHQPHPPGYPIYILAAKAFDAVAGDERLALGLLSIVSGALSLVAMAAFFRRLDQDPRSGTWALMATLLGATAPLYWFTSVRPLSDVPGLAASLAVQAFTLTATTGNRLAAAAFLGGLATGIRSQVAWLTVPLLILVAVRRPRPYRVEDALLALGALVAGGLVWFVPLVWLSGGPLAYWDALSNQGTEDLTGVGMLWTTHTVSQVLLVLNSTFIAPWGTPVLSGVVLALAAIGFVRLLAGSRPTLLLLLVAFVPYVIFDVLFQESVTTRYALPVVIPLAYLAVRGAAAVLRPSFTAALVGVVAAAGLLLGIVNVQAFAAEPAPAIRLLQDMRDGMPRLGAPPVLAMHRREQLDMRRPISWMLSDLPSWADRLTSTPKMEWLEVVKYFNTGSQSPVWFVADPLRSDLALIEHSGPRGRYRWPLTTPVLLGGVRPNEMDWYVFERPGWFLGEGWALTPETAGIADVGGFGRGRAPSQGWILRRPVPVTIVLGGRNFATDGSEATVTFSADGKVLAEFPVPPGFFLRTFTADLAGEGEYAPITVATRGSVAIEQFDAQPPDRPVFGYGDGWQEREYKPSTGSLWRWMSERAELRVRGTGRPLVFRMDGVTERFSKPSTIVVRIGDREITRQQAGRTFSIQASIPADVLGSGESVVTIETDQFYVPAEENSGSADRRHLALKVFDVSIR